MALVVSFRFIFRILSLFEETGVEIALGDERREVACRGPIDKDLKEVSSKRY